MEAPSLLETGVAIAIALQVWVAFRLYKLQREIERDRKTVEPYVHFQLSAKETGIKVMNTSPTAVRVEAITFSVVEVSGKKVQEQYEAPIIWLLPPFSTEPKEKGEARTIGKWVGNVLRSLELPGDQHTKIKFQVSITFVAHGKKQVARSLVYDATVKGTEMIDVSPRVELG
jgi:hypothetical protein